MEIFLYLKKIIQYSNLIFPKSQSQDVEIFGLEEQIEVFDHELKKTMGNSITANI